MLLETICMEMLLEDTVVSSMKSNAMVPDIDRYLDDQVEIAVMSGSIELVLERLSHESIIL